MGVGSDQDGTGSRRRLHSSGNVDGVAQGGVLYSEIGTYLAHDHQAGVDAHPYLEVHPPFALDLIPVGPYRLDDFQTRQNGPVGVILVGDGAPKKARIASPINRANVPP